MNLSRIDLDGIGAPAAIAARIHELLPALPPNFAIEDLCRALDIGSITLTDTNAYEAALIMDANKREGAILLSRSSRPKRRRFSIGHELGHFLIPAHMPRAGEGFACSSDDLRRADTRGQDRHRRIEAEANRFAAHLLMPPASIRVGSDAMRPSMRDILRLAVQFRVSKEAMARSYIEAHRATLAVVTVLDGRLDRIYRSDDFPWIEPRVRQTIPEDSIAADHRLQPGELTEMEECDPAIWLGGYGARRVEMLSEQVLGQSGGYAMVLLHAEISDDD